MTSHMEDSTAFADPLDAAAEITQKHNDSCIAHAQFLAAPEQDGSITECADCGADLEGRAAIFKIRCIRCQEALERKRKMYGLG